MAMTYTQSMTREQHNDLIWKASSKFDETRDFIEKLYQIGAITEEERSSVLRPFCDAHNAMNHCMWTSSEWFD